MIEVASFVLAIFTALAVIAIGGLMICLMFVRGYQIGYREAHAGLADAFPWPPLPQRSIRDIAKRANARSDAQEGKP